MTDPQDLEEFFQEPVPAEEPVPSGEPAAYPDVKALSRRKFLTGMVAGGAGGLLVSAGTGAALWQAREAELVAAKEAAEAECQALREAADVEKQAAKEAADTELARLLGLLDLQEKLEKIDLDGILRTGIAALALPLAAVAQGAEILKGGLEWAEKAVVSLREALPTAREAVVWLETQVSTVAQGIEKLETSIGQALGRASNNAVVGALKDFVGMILDNLPFGLGDKLRGVLDGLIGLITSVDEMVAGINTHLLEPLRDEWFSEEGSGIGAALADPLVEHVLDPLESHLADLSTLADTWQKKLVGPAEKALAERAEVRAEIARYKEDHGMV
jgi:hypothetical protein